MVLSFSIAELSILIYYGMEDEWDVVGLRDWWRQIRCVHSCKQRRVLDYDAGWIYDDTLSLVVWEDRSDDWVGWVGDASRCRDGELEVKWGGGGRLGCGEWELIDGRGMEEGVGGGFFEWIVRVRGCCIEVEVWGCWKEGYQLVRSMDEQDRVECVLTEVGFGRLCGGRGICIVTSNCGLSDYEE
ncbi:hypothetical protein Tco_0005766 [Tanacetum coccineum]